MPPPPVTGRPSRRGGKQRITVRQLLAHSSGLPAGIDPAGAPDPAAVYERIAGVKPLSAPGLGVLYSDLNFAALGKIVARTSGHRLDVHAERHIFEPLGMKHTRYRPPLAWQADIAPPAGTSHQHMRRGEVHDPLAAALEGIAGHAGLFGTADDLARFARDLLAPHGRLLKPDTVRTMLGPQTPPGSPCAAWAGASIRHWQATAPRCLPAGAASHYGFTGTALWLDPATGTYMIALSSRLHPDERGDAGPLRARLAMALSEALGPLSAATLARKRPELAELLAPYIPRDVAQPVLSGIDVLEARDFKPLRGKRIALLTHRSGVDSRGRRTIDVLHRAPHVTLERLFSSEHGLASDSEGKIGDDRDLATGLPIYSLYGERRRPAPAWLAGLDAVVVDLQDVGARFYTYATTLAYLMESAAQRHLPVYVLDRPNPIRADVVQGPVLDPELRRQRPALAAAIPQPAHAGQRDAVPGVGMIEGAEISVGRGTPTPFEVVGAPWIDGPVLSRALNARELPGLRFEPATFTPASATYAGQSCQGVRLRVQERNALDTAALGIVLAQELHQRYPANFSLARTLGSVGSRRVLDSIRNGETGGTLPADLAGFMSRRERYLIYR